MASIGEQTQSSPASFAPLAYPGDIVYLVYMLARLPGLSESVCCLLLSWQKEEKKCTVRHQVWGQSDLISSNGRILPHHAANQQSP